MASSTELPVQDGDTPSAAVTRSTRFVQWTEGIFTTVKNAWDRSPYFQPIVTFFVIEAAFIAFLTSILFVDPPMPLIDGIRSAAIVRGLLNTTFIVWQSLALVPVMGVVNFVYSSEWHFIYRRKRDDFVPGTVDLVSSLNSGWWQRTLYLLSNRSSSVFRLSFVVALLCLALATTGPSSVALVPTTLFFPAESTPIGYVPFLGNLTSGGLNTPAAAASKLAADALFWMIGASAPDVPPPSAKFQYQAIGGNILIPWLMDPAMQDLPTHTNISYITDIIQFQHNCTWNAPTWAAVNGESSTVLDGKSYWEAPDAPFHLWVPWMPSGVPPNVTSGIFPLAESIGADIIDGVVAFLFLGSNTTLTQPELVYLDLSGLPSLYSPTGFPFAPQPNGTAVPADAAKLASILVCHANMALGYAEVEVVLEAQVLGVTPSGGAFYTTNNTTPEAAVAIFSQAWSVALQTVEETMPPGVFVNSASRALFDLPRMQNSTGVTPGPQFTNASYAALVLDFYLPNMTQAYMYGYAGPGQPNMTFGGIYYRSKGVQEFVTSTLFRLLTCFLSLIVLLLLITIAFLPSGRNRQPLDVKSLLTLTGSTLETNSLADPSEKE